MQSVQN